MRTFMSVRLSELTRLWSAKRISSLYQGRRPKKPTQFRRQFWRVASLFNEGHLMMRRVMMLVVLVCVTCGLHAHEPSAGHHAWKSYTDVRFQYAICYPEDLLVPQGESDLHQALDQEYFQPSRPRQRGQNKADTKGKVAQPWSSTHKINCAKT
jgi:hypothetical protein